MNERQEDSATDFPTDAEAATLLRMAPVGLMIETGTGGLWANDELLAMLDTRREEWPSVSAQRGAELRAGSEPVRITGHDGTVRHLRRIPFEAGGLAPAAWYFLDMSRETELENDRDALAAKVAALDVQDRETGLPNKLGILAALDRHLTRSRRYGNPLAVIRLTLEPPEHCSDASSTLLAVSREFRAQLRWADEVGRLDRTTFLLILPETAEENAGILAAKLERERLALGTEVEGWTLNVMAAAWQKGDDRRKLLNRAGWQSA
jgi:GGDEF domain-containing protein